MNIQMIKEKIRQNPKVAIISLVSFLLALVLIIVLTVVLSKNSKNDEDADLLGNDYFTNSLLNSIKNREWSFSAEIEVYKIVTSEDDTPKKELTSLIYDKYDFESKSEQINLKFYDNGINLWAYDLLTINNMKEMYQINSNNLKACVSPDSANDLLRFYLEKWIPKDVLDYIKISLISPNYLLFYLLTFSKEKNRNDSFDIECRKIRGTESQNNPVKCTLVKNEITKIEYNFEDYDGETMYPKHIQIFKKEEFENRWIFYREIKFIKFEVESYRKIVSINLPIGLGCVRQNGLKYERLNHAFQNQFEFDYNLNLTYLDEKTKKIVYKTSSNRLYASVSSLGQTVPYELKMFVSEGVNEETTRQMKTFYDQSINFFVDYYPEENDDDENDDRECRPYNYQGPESLNFFYFQDFFTKDSKMFDFTDGYSYLGTYEVKGTESLVFEKILKGFNKNLKKENELSYQNRHSKNLNHITSDHAIATYYYDAEQSRFYKTGRLTIPFKMEFRLKGNDNKTDVGQLTIDITDYSPSFSHERIFENFKYCIKKPTSYEMMSINYTQMVLRSSKDSKESIKEKFRKKIKDFISSLRVNHLEIKYKDETENPGYGEKIAATIEFRLYDTLYAENEFEVTENEDFEGGNFDDNSFFKDINAEECARKCLSFKECGSYSHSKPSATCKLWTIENYNGQLYRNGKIDFSKYFQTVKKADSKLGRRLSFYIYPKHRPSEKLIDAIKTKIEKKKLDFYVDDFFEAKGMIHKRVDDTNAYYEN